MDKSGLSSAPRPTNHNQHPTTATELYNGREETPKGGREMGREQTADRMSAAAYTQRIH